MRVTRFTALDGRFFYNDDLCAEIIAATVNRMGGCKQIDVLEMTRDDYFAIPATNESAELWRLPAGQWQRQTNQA